MMKSRSILGVMLSATAIVVAAMPSAAEEDDRTKSPFYLSAVEKAAREDRNGLSEASDAARKAWIACVQSFAEKAAIVQSDPTDLVVDIALISCEDERRRAELAWARHIFAASAFKPSASTAVTWTIEAYDGFQTNQRRRLQPHISLHRQILQLKSEGDQIRRELGQ